MEYHEILSPEMKNERGQSGKWYHGRFHPKPKTEPTQKEVQNVRGKLARGWMKEEEHEA
jgi:hypothetical protein